MIQAPASAVPQMLIGSGVATAPAMGAAEGGLSFASAMAEAMAMAEAGLQSGLPVATAAQAGAVAAVAPTLAAPAAPAPAPVQPVPGPDGLAVTLPPVGVGAPAADVPKGALPMAEAEPGTAASEDTSKDTLAVGGAAPAEAAISPSMIALMPAVPAAPLAPVQASPQASPQPGVQVTAAAPQWGDLPGLAGAELSPMASAAPESQQQPDGMMLPTGASDTEPALAMPVIHDNPAPAAPHPQKAGAARDGATPAPVLAVPSTQAAAAPDAVSVQPQDGAPAPVASASAAAPQAAGGTAPNTPTQPDVLTQAMAQALAATGGGGPEEQAALPAGLRARILTPPAAADRPASASMTANITASHAARPVMAGLASSAPQAAPAAASLPNSAPAAAAAEPLPASRAPGEGAAPLPEPAALPADPLPQHASGLTLAAAASADAPSSAQAPHAAATAAPLPPALQLMPAVALLSGRGGREMQRLTIAIAPEELGRVEVAVERRDDGPTSIRVTAERPETLMLLLRDQRRLDAALQDAGVGGQQGCSLRFELGGGSAGFGAGGNGQQPQEGQALRHGMAGQPADMAAATAAASPLHARGAAARPHALIDLAV
jgi:hypothetical protein